MSPRTTRTEVQAVFELLCRTVGVPVSTGFDPETRKMARGWGLDYSSAYGGYVVVSYDGMGTSEGRPLGDLRRPAGPFVDCLRLAIRAVEASRGQVA